MVGAVDRRAHEVRHAGVEADVLLVRVLLMEHGGDEPARITRDAACTLRTDADIAEPGGAHDLIVEPFDARTDGVIVDAVLLGAVRDAEAAAEVDKLNVDAEFFLQLRRQLEHETRREEECLRAQLGRDHHRVHAEPLHAHLKGAPIALEHLLTREPVFCLDGLSDNIVALDEVAGVVAEAEEVRQAGVLRHVVKVTEVIEVDDGTELDRLLELLIRRIVRGEHDLLALDARCGRDNEFGGAAAVRARSVLMQNLNNARIRQCFYGKVLTEARRPCECLAQTAEVRTDLCLVVEMKRGRVPLDETQRLLLRERKFLLIHIILPWCKSLFPHSCEKDIYMKFRYYSNEKSSLSNVSLDERRALPYNVDYIFHRHYLRGYIHEIRRKSLASCRCTRRHSSSWLGTCRLRRKYGELGRDPHRRKL